MGEITLQTTEETEEQAETAALAALAVDSYRAVLEDAASAAARAASPAAYLTAARGGILQGIDLANVNRAALAMPSGALQTAGRLTSPAFAELLTGARTAAGVNSGLARWAEAAGAELQQTRARIAQWADELGREQERILATIRNRSWGIGGLPWPEPTPGALWARQPLYLPESEPAPPAGQIEALQVAVQVADRPWPIGDEQLTLDRLAVALAEGKLPVQAVMRLCLQYVPRSKPGRKAPPIAEQLALVLGWYAVRDKRGSSRVLQDWYCAKAAISRATLYRYEQRCKALGLI